MRPNSTKKNVTAKKNCYQKKEKMLQNLKTQIVKKKPNSNCDIPQKLKL